MFKIITGFKLGPGQFRFLLAFLVLLFHTLGFFPLGHYAVYVFFLLSGYWIFKMYEEKYSHYKNAYWVYIRSRLMRLLFVYWLVLALAIIVFFVKSSLLNNDSWRTFNLPEIFLKNIGVMGLNTSPIVFITPAWSLEIEIQFYLIVPLLILLRRYINIKLQLILSLMILATILYFVPLEKRIPNLFFSLPFFLIGAWLYYSAKIFTVKATNIALLLFAAVLLVNFVIPGLREAFLVKTNPLFGADQYQDQVNVVLALLTIPFLTRNITQKVTDAHDGTWSSMSFVIYLVHWPIMKLYNTALILNGEKHKMLYLMLFYIASLLFAYIISIKYDSYFESVRRKWLKKQEKATVAAPVVFT